MTAVWWRPVPATLPPFETGTTSAELVSEFGAKSHRGTAAPVAAPLDADTLHLSYTTLLPPTCPVHCFT